jgi:hypothetical protein
MSTKQSNEINTKQRNTTWSPSRNSSTQKSKDVELPTTILLDIYHKIRDVVLFFCRRIIFGPPIFKLLVTFAIILIGSILRKWEYAPTSYLSSKTNIFNRYFAKLGWGWTMSLLIPFIYLTLITTHNHYQIITRHLVRLLIATGVWYIITFVFVHVEAYTAKCKPVDKRGLSRNDCLRDGHDWQDGVDFSGHTFLLLYALLIINEEVKSYDKGTKKVDQASKATANQSGDKLVNIEHERLEIFSKIIRILYVALAALTILWEFMLLSTALYFHEVSHKIAAAGIAVFFWYITYYVWYRPDSPSLLYPSSPKD